jgi:hypothetical protein
MSLMGCLLRIQCPAKLSCFSSSRMLTNCRPLYKVLLYLEHNHSVYDSMHSVGALCSNHLTFSVRVQVTASYRRIDSTQTLNNFILTAPEMELLFQIFTNRIQVFKCNAFLISKSFVQFSSQDPKYLKSLTRFVLPVETHNSMEMPNFLPS